MYESYLLKSHSKEIEATSEVKALSILAQVQEFFLKNENRGSSMFAYKVSVWNKITKKHEI